jgi:hypothetical protein
MYQNLIFGLFTGSSIIPGNKFSRSEKFCFRSAVLLLSDSPPPGEGEKSAVYPPPPGPFPPGGRGNSGSFRSAEIIP